MFYNREGKGAINATPWHPPGKNIQTPAWDCKTFEFEFKNVDNGDLVTFSHRLSKKKNHNEATFLITDLG